MARGSWYIETLTHRGRKISQSGPFRSEQEAEDTLHDLIDSGTYDLDSYCYAVNEQ